MKGAIRAALLGAVAALLAGCGGEGGARADAPVGTAAGEQAPPLRGRLPDGGSFSLESERGSTTVAVFVLGADCGLCREQLRRLQEHHADYQAAGAEVVAVTPDPPASNAALSRRLGLAFPLVSADSAAAAAWGVRQPATFLVDGEGRVRWRYLGRSAADRVPDEAVLAVLRESTGTPTP